MKNNIINICFVTDDNYAIHAGVAMCSILENANEKDNFAFYIFDNGISDEKKSKLQKMASDKVTIKYVALDSVAKKYQTLTQTVKHITKSSYFKFAIADLLPDVDKIIYLDSDLIVETSLKDLFDVKLGDNLIAAVEDVGYTYWSKYNPELKLKFKCMNSGVMLINCDLWRKENQSSKLLECAADHDKVGFGQDQPVLNFVLKDRVLFLPFKWNVQDTFFRDEIELADRPERAEIDDVKQNPGIIHYTYVRKPWNDFGVVKAAHYWKYYKRSCFYDADNYINMWLEPRLDFVNSALDEACSTIKKYSKVKELYNVFVKKSLKYKLIRFLAHITFGKMKKHFKNMKRSMLM